jgi:hypothetical protein
VEAVGGRAGAEGTFFFVPVNSGWWPGSLLHFDKGEGKGVWAGGEGQPGAPRVVWSFSYTGDGLHRAKSAESVCTGGGA